jgi:hypothetical protein
MVTFLSCSYLQQHEFFQIESPFISAPKTRRAALNQKKTYEEARKKGRGHVTAPEIAKQKSRNSQLSVFILTVRI